jgi:hypothetical protein
MIRTFAFLIVLLAAPIAARPAGAVPAIAAPSTGTEWSAARFCTREYRPVCARTPFGRLRTFPNRCEARAAGARVVHPGRCRGRAR